MTGCVGGPGSGPTSPGLLNNGMPVKSLSMGWLKDHVYIAAWCSPMLTLITLVVRNTIRPADKVNWSMIMLYVAFLTSFAVLVTPGVDGFGKGAAIAVAGLTISAIATDAQRNK